MLEPKLIGILKHRKEDLTKEQLRKDIIAGIIVAIIALPLSVALAIASGVTPDKGLVTAIIAGFLISALGGSRVQIGGPTGAFVVIIYGIIQKHGLDGLLIATILAGILMILMGICKFGSVLKFIPYPTTTGFTTGIAVVLLSTQVKDFFGLSMKSVPSDFIPKWIAYFKSFNTINLSTALVAITALLIIIYWPKINKTIPGSLVALISVTLVVTIFKIPVETIGSRFGEINRNINFVDFSKLSISFDKIQTLMVPAITIAFLAAIESLLSAVVADGMIGKKHNSNMELIGQGVANIASALFGGIPATGAIARTAANVKNGGRTPVAGIVHALILLLIMLVFMPMAKLIPMAVLASILVVVSINMCDFKSIKTILHSTRSDALVLIVTFLLTVIFDLVVAIALGMIIAMFLFVRRMSENKLIKDVTEQVGLNLDETDENYLEENDNIDVKKLLDQHIAVYEINGPFFYGVVNTFVETLSDINAKTKVLILRMRNVSSADVTALNALSQIEKRCHENSIDVIYTELHDEPLRIFKNSGYIKRRNPNQFIEKFEDAIIYARDLIGAKYYEKKSKEKNLKEETNLN